MSSAKTQLDVHITLTRKQFEELTKFGGVSVPLGRGKTLMGRLTIDTPENAE